MKSRVGTRLLIVCIPLAVLIALLLHFGKRNQELATLIATVVAAIPVIILLAQFVLKRTTTDQQLTSIRKSLMEQYGALLTAQLPPFALPMTLEAKLRGASVSFEIGANGPGLAAKKLFPNGTRSLVVLIGPPGSGKSTFLQEWVIACLKGDSQTPWARDAVPIILNASTWRAERHDLESFVIDQVRLQVNPVSKRSLRELINQNFILPILDGIDEMPQDSRAVLATEVKKFIARHPQGRMILASTQQALQDLPSVSDRHLIELRPLTSDRIRGYLKDRGILARIAVAFGTSPPGDKIPSRVTRAVDSPLFLSLISDYVLYGPGEASLPGTSSSTAALRDALLDYRVSTSMLALADAGYEPALVTRYFRFIAHHLEDRGSTAFAWWHVAFMRPRFPRLALWVLPLSLAMFILGNGLATLSLAAAPDVLQGRAGDGPVSLFVRGSYWVSGLFPGWSTWIVMAAAIYVLPLVVLLTRPENEKSLPRVLTMSPRFASRNVRNAMRSLNATRIAAIVSLPTFLTISSYQYAVSDRGEQARGTMTSAALAGLLIFTFVLVTLVLLAVISLIVVASSVSVSGDDLRFFAPRASHIGDIAYSAYRAGIISTMTFLLVYWFQRLDGSPRPMALAIAWTAYVLGVAAALSLLQSVAMTCALKLAALRTGHLLPGSVPRLNDVLALASTHNLLRASGPYFQFIHKKIQTRLASELLSACICGSCKPVGPSLVSRLQSLWR